MVKAIAAIAVIAMLSICSMPLQIIGDVSADPTYGVRLSGRRDPDTGETEPLMKEIRLSQEIIFNITVTNIGTGLIEPARDTIYLRVDNSTIPSGWSAYLDTPSHKGNDDPDHVRLASDENTTIVLHVNAPWIGWVGDKACIDLTGNSSNDHSAIDTISLYAVLNVSVDFDLQFMKAPEQDPLSPWFREKYDRIDPGDEQQYIISLMNKGDLNDSYSLSLSEPPSGSGWEWYFVDTGTRYLGIDLGCRTFEDTGARSGATISIDVKCPADALAYEEGNITVTGWSHTMEDHGGNLTRSDDLKLVTGSVGSAYLTVDKDTFYAHPNQTVFVDCTIHSTANHDIKVWLDARGTPTGWIVRYPSEDIFVPTYGSVTVQIRITAPGYFRQSEYGHYSYIRIGCHGQSIDDYVNITFINGWKGGFDLSVVQDFSEVLPGNGSGASLKIISHYDNPMNVTVEAAEAPQGWSVKIMDGIGPVNYTLGPWGEDWAGITVSVPEDALAGNYTINVTARSDSMTVNISLPITVGQRQMIDLGHYFVDPPQDPSGDPFAIPANATEQVWFLVENRGNGPERVHLVFGEERIKGGLARWDIGIVSVGRVREDRPDISNDGGGDYDLAALPHGFEYSTLYHGRGHMIAFRDIWIGLGAYETAWVRVLFGAPGLETMVLTGNGSLFSMAQIAGEEEYDNVTLSVLYPDLHVQNVTVSGPEGGPPVHDGNVTVGITVRNDGTCRADDVLVTIEAGGSVAASGRITTIGPGGSGTIELSFIASKHIRKYTIEIDPGNEIIESADQFMENGTNDNNLYSITIDVKGSEKADEGTSPILRWSLMVISIVIAVVGVSQLLAMRSRRRRKAKERFVPE